MQLLNLPQYSFSIKSEGNTVVIFDKYRKKYVKLTPEEWVRQNFVEYLIAGKNYPESLIGVEVSLKVNQLIKRCDVVIYNRTGEPVAIVECKAPSIKITDKTLRQIGIYNIKMKVRYLMLTNGLVHFCCKIDFETQQFEFLKDIPDFNELTNTSQYSMSV